MHRLALFTAVLVGCSVTQSEDLETSGMAATITVSADGSGTSTVTTRLSTDANALNSIQLDSGDILSATADTQSEDMSVTNVLGDITYNATFSGGGQGGTPYIIALNRRAGFISAPSSLVSMPQPFDITEPSSSSTISRSDDVTVTYDMSGTSDAMSWSVTSGACASAASGSLSSDSGSFTISKGALAPTEANEQTATCQVTITLERTRSGTIDPHYGYGGTITAAQTRSITFTSTF
jgi:hypothetical protein